MKDKKIWATVLWGLFFVRPLHAQDQFRRHEVSPLVVFFTGDVLRTSTLGALQYTYRFNDTWWVGASGMMGGAKMDDPSGLKLKNGDLFFQTEGNLYLNIPSLMNTRKGETNATQVDLYTVIGLGVVGGKNSKEIVGSLGGGMIIHFPAKGLEIKFDLKNFFYTMRNSQGSDFISDLSLSVGPSLRF